MASCMYMVNPVINSTLFTVFVALLYIVTSVYIFLKIIKLSLPRVGRKMGTVECNNLGIPRGWKSMVPMEPRVVNVQATKEVSKWE